MNRSYLVCFFVLIGSITLTPVFQTKASAAQSNDSHREIPLYTYHTHPPFILEKGGLSYDLANLLTERAKGRYTFTVKQMSRPRLNKIIAQQRTGIVPWVNPAWFKDKEEKKYMWTKGFLMEDGNAIISSSKKRFVYEGPESLKGLIFGGVRGHNYSGIDEYIEKTGQAQRVNTENHIDNFRKLRKGRIDVTLMPLSGAEYLIKKEGLKELLFISPKAHSTFRRRVMVIHKDKKILAFLESILSTIHSDRNWLDYRQQYQ